MIVNRYRYIEQLSRSKNNGLIKIITGLRRSGKSFLLKKLFHQHLLDEGVREDHILVIDMESRKNREFKNPDYLLDWVEKMMIDYETYYIIIDEVQEVEDFVEVLSSLSVTEGADVYVTGSNSRFLSSDLVTEAQVNTMLSTLLKRGIRAEKTAAGKAGFTLSVDEDQLVQSLEILKENNLPRADYENLGKVFSGQGMISSASEEQARMAYAISQELSDTFSRIDGVLTARVHVVLGGTDQATDTRTLPSAAVFLRHTPDSPVVNLVAKIRELTSKAVPDLDYERVSVMLVPVREQVSVPMEPTPKFLGLPLAPQNGPPYALIGAGIVFLAALAGLALLALSLRDALRKRKEAANASEDQSS